MHRRRENRAEQTPSHPLVPLTIKHWGTAITYKAPLLKVFQKFQIIFCSKEDFCLAWLLLHTLPAIAMGRW